MCIAVAPPTKKPGEKGKLIKKISALLLLPLRLIRPPTQPAAPEATQSSQRLT